MQMESAVHRPALSVVVRIMLKPGYSWLLLLNKLKSVSFGTPDLRLCFDTVRQTFPTSLQRSVRSGAVTPVLEELGPVIYV